MTQAVIGYGTVFQRGNGASPEVFSAIGEVVSVAGPGLSRDAVDATHYTSPNGYREFISGMRDGGEVSVSMNLTTTNLATLKTDFDADTEVNYKIVETFGSPLKTWAFSGLLTSLEIDRPNEDKVTINATFKISGKPTLT